MTDPRYAAPAVEEKTGSAQHPARRRGDGERSHQVILEAAMRLSTVQGLDGLSIGELAAQIGMSKSGLYAHFRSKEALQLATVNAALELIDVEVLRPALGRPDPLSRLSALCDNFLSYAQHALPGGCFFASVGAELDTRPGPVRDLLVKHHREWIGLITRMVEEAQESGFIDPDEEPAQLAFELNSYLHLANDTFVLLQDPAAIERARRGVAHRLRAAAPEPRP